MVTNPTKFYVQSRKRNSININPNLTGVTMAPLSEEVFIGLPLSEELLSQHIRNASEERVISLKESFNHISTTLRKAHAHTDPEARKRKFMSIYDDPDWVFVLKSLGLDHSDDFFSSCYMGIQQRLKDIITLIETTTESFVVPSKKEFERYLRVAEFLSKNSEIALFKSVHLQANASHDNYVPFGFVCAPSGTGKTNMAFSLDVPFLYFMYSSTTQQDINRCFEDQSNILIKLIERDLKDYFRGTNTNDEKTAKVVVESLFASEMAFRSAGFLCQMVNTVVKEFWSANGQRNSADIQINLETISFRSMTIKQARKEIINLFISSESQAESEKSFFFPIFFDECSFELSAVEAKNSNNMQWEKDQEHYLMFIRSLVRCLKCSPIFMGTNAKAANFLGMSKGSSSGNTSPIPWCIVWHRLPGTCQDIFASLMSNIRQKLERFRILSNSNFPNDQVVIFLEKYLEKERPLFLYFVENYADFLMRSAENYAKLEGKNPYPKVEAEAEILKFSSNAEFLALLLEDVIGQFRDRKESKYNFNLGQLSYMSAISWSKISEKSYVEELIEEPACEKLKRSTERMSVVSRERAELANQLKDTNLYIHRHLGFLNATPDNENFPFNTTLTTESSETGFKRKYMYHQRDLFKVSTTFDLFRSSPFTGLLCTGISNDNQTILVSKSPRVIENLKKRKHYGGSRVSVINCIAECIEPPETITEHRKTPSGFVLELALYCSVVIASHAYGFSGISVEPFLMHLCRELDFNGKYGDKLQPPIISFDEKFSAKFLHMDIPFISPMSTQKWKRSFVEDLKIALELKEVFLGVGYPDINKSRADLLVKSWPEGEKILAGECKLYSRNLNASDFKEIIAKFNTHQDCQLFIIAAPQFTKSDFYEENYCFWTFERKNGILTQKLLNRKQRTSREKHVLLLSLSNIYSGDTRKEYDDKIKLLAKTS